MQRIINPALAKANMSKTELGARCMGAEFNCSFDFPDGTKIGTKGE